MTNEPSTNLESLFSQAINISDADEREAFVAHACSGNSTLFRELEQLVSAHFEETGLLDVPALGQAPTLLGRGGMAEHVGTKIGRYKLLQEIGAITNPTVTKVTIQDLLTGSPEAAVKSSSRTTAAASSSSTRCISSKTPTKAVGLSAR